MYINKENGMILSIQKFSCLFKNWDDEHLMYILSHIIKINVQRKHRYNRFTVQKLIQLFSV